MHPFGNFINPDLVVAKQRNPQTVTFINPAFAKGVAVVARLILMANKERPDISFMVVETRKKFADALRALKKPGSEVGSAFQNLSTAGKAQRFAGFVSSVGSSGSAAVTISAAKTFALAA